MSHDIRRSSSSSKVDRYFPGRMPPIHPSEKRASDINPTSSDPRLRGERKLHGRKLLKTLPVPEYEWNSDSVGDPPLGRIMLHDLPKLVPLSVVTTAIARFGTVDRVEILRDDDAAPLPLATVVFKGEMGYKCAKSAAAAKEVRIMDKTAKITLDLDGKKSSQRRQQLIDMHIKLKMPAPKGPRVEREKELQKEREKEREKELEISREREREKRAMSESYPSSTRPRSPIRGVPLTPRMRDEICDDPFAFISDRYLPSYGRDAPRTEEVFRLVRRFRPEAVLRDQYGWYVIFTKSRYCQDCIYELDGVRFLGYRIKMEEGNRPRPTSQPSNSKRDVTLSAEKSDRYGRQYDENKSVSRTDGERLSKETESKTAYDIIMSELNKVLTAEIQQRVINREIYDVLKENMNKERERRDAELEKEREIASKQLAARREATKTKQLKLSKPLRLLSEEKDDKYDKDDKESEASTRMTTPVVSSPADHHTEFKSSKRRAIRDFSSSESESDEPEPKRRKAEGIDETLSMEIDEEEPVEHLPTPVPEPVEATVEKGQQWAPKSGEKPTRIVEDPDGPYTVLQILNMVKDEEDLNHLKLAAEGLVAADIGSAESFVYNKRQVSGGLQPHEFTSFKSRGYVKIPEIEKDSYLLHRIQKKAMPVQARVDTGEEEVKVSSRGNRVNARREEKQFTENFDVLSINKLKKRKKPVEFRRSAIHDWGLYAMEHIPQGDMIIEYVGEVIRSSLQDTRERTYQRSGIGSSYLFHVDNTQVIDATKRGGIARFINHSCDPSCLAKIIQMQGTSRIVIYAAKDVGRGEELTYDYKFEREEGEDRVPCLCGSAKCKGWLN